MVNNYFFNKKPFLIGEISSNHCGSLSIAKKIIDDCKKYNIDAIKLQTYTPDCMTLRSNLTNFKINHGLWKKKKLWHLYNKAKTPLEWHKELFIYAKRKKIKIFSTPFSVKALNFLETLNCPVYKVASFEITDLYLIKKIAQTKKPIILSTGLSTINEISKAYKVAKENGSKDITILYCVSNYPSNINDFNLNFLKIFKKKFKCRIGLSDHSNSLIPSTLSITLGAEVFEKHIGLGNHTSLDSDFSLTGKEIYNYQKNLVNSYKTFNKSNKHFRSKNELKNKVFRRSIYAIKDISSGEILNTKNIKALRPFYKKGIDVEKFEKILGKKSNFYIKKGALITKV